MEPTIQIEQPMQSTEAYPLEDHSLRADETLAEQRDELAASDAYAPIFIP